MRYSLAVALVLVLFAATSTATAGDPEAGKRKAAEKYCVSCHGIGGISNLPKWPNLAGQHETYLKLALRAYRAQDREGTSAASMYNPFVLNLTDEDIDDLAAYYASLEWNP